MSHTPGPWHRNIKPASKYAVVFAGRNTHIAVVCSQGLTEEQVEGNCDLIASAPELLEALQQSICHSCLNRIGHTGAHVHDSEVPDRYDWRNCAACVITRAAVAKAEGRQA